jgi:hypothetical protein
MDQEKRVEALVNKIMDEGFETYSKIKVAVKKVDLILDNLSECGCGPKMNREGDDEVVDKAYDNDDVLNTAEEMGDLEGVEPEESYEEVDNTVNDIPHEPNQIDAVQVKQLSNQLGENTVLKEDYQQFFRMMMKRHNISSIGSLTPEQKTEFFNKVKAEWQRAGVIKRISS